MNLSISEDHIESLMIKTLANITGLDPNKGEIRLAYSQEGQPSWKHNDTVVALYLAPNNDLYDEDIWSSYRYNGSKHDTESSFTQVYGCEISCYGPKCRDLAQLIRVAIQLDENRLLLSKENIYPIAKPQAPRYIPYEYQNQWWKRCDLTIMLNIFTTLSSEVDTISSTEIKLITEKGEQDVIIAS